MGRSLGKTTRTRRAALVWVGPKTTPTTRAVIIPAAAPQIAPHPHSHPDRTDKPPLALPQPRSSPSANRFPAKTCPRSALPAFAALGSAGVSRPGGEQPSAQVMPSPPVNLAFGQFRSVLGPGNLGGWRNLRPPARFGGSCTPPGWIFGTCEVVPYGSFDDARVVCGGKSPPIAAACQDCGTRIGKTPDRVIGGKTA
jgi:hypothetical protein